MKITKTSGKGVPLDQIPQGSFAQLVHEPGTLYFQTAAGLARVSDTTFSSPGTLVRATDPSLFTPVTVNEIIVELG